MFLLLLRSISILLVLLSSLLGVSELRAQSLDPHVRRVQGSAGDQVSTSSLQISYTVGESVVFTGQTNERFFTQGFQQGLLVPVEELELEIYNAFSPNGDGINEKWIIENIGQYPENRVLIFNRWGDRLKKYQGYDNEGKVWTGTGPNGKELPAGTYFYVIESGEGLTEKGYVQITK